MTNKYPYTDFNEYNMDWIIKTVKDLSVQWAETHTEWEDTKTEWENYKNYIDNYFENLDVSQEISDKIDQLIADGYFNTLFYTLFSSEAAATAGEITTQWISDNLLQEVGYVLDTSLTVENAAADAKAAGDYVLNITEDTINLNKHGSARKSANGSGVISASGTTNIGLNDYLPIEDETQYTVKLFDMGGATGARFYCCFYDSSKVMIGTQASNYRAGTTPSYTYTSPTGAAYMFFNAYDGGGLASDTKIVIVKGSTAPTAYISPYSAIDITSRNNITKLLSEAVRLQTYVSTDLDDFKNIGYYFTGWSESLTNSPTADVGSRIIITFGIPSSNVFGQLHYNYNTKDIYFRVYLSGSWQAWKLLNEKAILFNESLESHNTDETYTTSSSLNHGNKAGRVKIMSYNVAHWNNDTAVYISDEKIINVKKLLMTIDADTVCLQEDGGYIDSGSSKNTLEHIFAPLYCYKLGTGANTIYDKKSDYFQNYNLTDGGGDPLITVRRTAVQADGKTLYIYNCHLDVASQTKRSDQLDAIMTDIIAVENPSYWVLLGDFNTLTPADVTKLESVATNNNATLANGGYLGWLSSNKNDVAIDNMICSQNVLIREYHILENWFNSLYSDHYPTYAILELL